MATTIAHRQHIHVPLTPIIAVLATAVVAAAVLVLINQPTTTSTSTKTQAAAVPMPESPALRQQVAAGTVQVGTGSEPFAYPLNHVQGTTMYPASSYELAPPAPTYLPGGVADPHPLNHFAGQPR